MITSGQRGAIDCIQIPTNFGRQLYDVPLTGSNGARRMGKLHLSPYNSVRGSLHIRDKNPQNPDTVPSNTQLNQNEP